MLGCSRLAARSASRRNRARNSGSAESSAESTLSATLRGRVGWRARYTVPIPPAPSTRSMVYPDTWAPAGMVIAASLARRSSGGLSFRGQHHVLGGQSAASLQRTRAGGLDRVAVHVDHTAKRRVERLVAGFQAARRRHAADGLVGAVGGVLLLADLGHDGVGGRGGGPRIAGHGGDGQTP